MERVLQFIADYRWWLAGLLGLLMIFYLWRAFKARREAARAMFKLEREQAQAKYGRNVIVLRSSRSCWPLCLRRRTTCCRL